MESFEMAQVLRSRLSALGAYSIACTLLLLCQLHSNGQVPASDTISTRRLQLLGDSGEELIVLDTKSGDPIFSMNGKLGHKLTMAMTKEGTKVSLNTDESRLFFDADPHGRVGLYMIRGDKTIGLRFADESGQPQLVLNGVQSSIVMATAEDEAATVRFLDKQKNVRMNVGIDAGAMPAMSMHDQAGEAQWLQVLESKGRLRVMTPNK
jgi:hypothetical protein